MVTHHYHLRKRLHGRHRPLGMAEVSTVPSFRWWVGALTLDPVPVSRPNATRIRGGIPVRGRMGKWDADGTMVRPFPRRSSENDRPGWRRHTALTSWAHRPACAPPATFL